LHPKNPPRATFVTATYSHRKLRVACGVVERLLGLAIRRDPGYALLIPRCRSVHTFGMRYALDLHWLAADGSVVRVDHAVPPWRVRSCRQAAAVVECPAGG
jgi:uncharacterized membrane protein (UPF0127 family)